MYNLYLACHQVGGLPTFKNSFTQRIVGQLVAEKVVHQPRMVQGTWVAKSIVVPDCVYLLSPLWCQVKESKGI